MNPDAPRIAAHIAIFAKAPMPGTVKTRLMPALGARGAARLHRQLVQHAVSVARAAAPGHVTLWCAPHTGHPFFRAMAQKHATVLAQQCGGDLGARMLHAITHHAPGGATLLIGSDCPALTPTHLHAAANVLCAGQDAVFIPAEDGGYVLIGAREVDRSWFEGVNWGTESVYAQTLARLDADNTTWQSLAALQDIDRPEDLPLWQALAVDQG